MLNEEIENEKSVEGELVKVDLTKKWFHQVTF